MKVLTSVLALLVLTLLGGWLLRKDTGKVQEATHEIAAGQQQAAKRAEENHTDLADKLDQVQQALSRIQQTTDPISEWPKERLETELARQMQIEVKDLRTILAAGKTSVDALLQGQALLASGKVSEAGEKFDIVIEQEKDAIKRLRQAYEGKAQIAFDAARYEEALAFREKAAALVDRTTDPIGWAYAQGEITVIDIQLARYEHAEPLMKEIVRLCEPDPGSDDPALSTALNNLAQLYTVTNRLSEAEPLMQRALKIDEERLGPDDLKVARDLNNLAELYHDNNRLTDAEQLFNRALKIDEKSLGQDHSKVAIDLNNLASLYQTTNPLTDAELLMQRALKIFEKNLGPNHPMVATCLSNLAILYQTTNRLAEAEPLFKRALKINEQSLGLDHPKVARDLDNLASLFQDTNRLAEAEPLEWRAIVILLRTTRAAGRVVPNLKTSIISYDNTLSKLSLPTTEIAARLASALREAGYTEEELTKLITPNFGPFDVAVKEVMQVGLGHRLGIQVGDVVLRYAGQEITKTAELTKLVGETQGETVQLEIQRGGKILTLMAKPGKLGLQLEDRPRSATEQNGIEKLERYTPEMGK